MEILSNKGIPGTSDIPGSSIEHLAGLFYADIPLAIAVTDLITGEVVEANQAAASMLGMTREELIGMANSKLTCDDEEKRQIRNFDLFQKGEIENRKLTLQKKTGEKVEVLWNAHILRSQGRDFIVNTGIDITESQKISGRLLESENKFSAAFHGNPLSMCIMDLQKGLLVDANAQFFKLFDLKKEEAIGRKTQELSMWNNDSRMRFMEAVTRAGSVDNVPVEFQTLSGRKIDTLVSARMLEMQEGKFLVSSAVDVTEYRKTQAKLMDAQKMDSIGALAAGIAHDFNNMLACVSCNAENMLDQEKDSDRKEKLSDIMKASELASNLIDKLLTFARTKKSEPKPINLNSIVQDVLSLGRRTAGKKISIEFSESENLHILKADPSQISQAVMNLLVNAVEALPQGGTVKLKTENVTVTDDTTRPEPTGDYVLLTVSDTGPGLTEQARAHLFEPFFTTKENTKKPGTGLGLAMLHRIVTNHGGFVEVESVKDAGAVFKVYLPCITRINQDVHVLRHDSVRGSAEVVTSSQQP
ncbi:MAG: PAS domain S-box protein [Candidatus Wallbacteria bacterium]|nr:PAS domain S-box protein [Candidatus Wallbacteria bacterium]